mmetsp:Transcript_9146/g.21504  ORF Transcript_9146/g.21504 Transcript_9146/m.21504 type:complete len:287 (-) Transcript_9146:116-976(-)
MTDDVIAKFRRRCDTLPFFTVVIRLKIDGIVPIGIKDGIGTLNSRDGGSYLASGLVGVFLGAKDGGGIDKITAGTAGTADGRSGTAHLGGVVGSNGRGETSHGHGIFIVVTRFRRRGSANADARRTEIGPRTKRLRQGNGGKVVRQIGRRERSRQVLLLLRRRSPLSAARPGKEAAGAAILLGRALLFRRRGSYSAASLLVLLGRFARRVDNGRTEPASAASTMMTFRGRERISAWNFIERGGGSRLTAAAARPDDRRHDGTSRFGAVPRGKDTASVSSVSADGRY